jgi:hypothetical protein
VEGCGCPGGHLDPLGASSELAFPWAGVLVLPVDYELYGEMATGPARHDFGGPLHQFQHGIVHFVEALGSPFLHNHGLRLLRAAHAVVEAPGSGRGGVRRRGRPAEAPALVRALLCGPA